MNTSTAAADMSSATTPAKMRPTASAPTAVSASATTPTMSASPTSAAPGHRIDRAGEGHDGCQEEGNESNSAMCHGGFLGAKVAWTGEPAEATHRAAMNYFCCWLLAFAWVEHS
jgi:hypothetical protein